jgi:hypothetical protein
MKENSRALLLLLLLVVVVVVVAAAAAVVVVVIRHYSRQDKTKILGQLPCNLDQNRWIKNDHTYG